VINLGSKPHISGFCQIHFSNKLAEQTVKSRIEQPAEMAVSE